MTGAVAILCALVLIAMAALGPSGTGDIEYRTSQSGLWQVMGQDLADLFVAIGEEIGNLRPLSGLKIRRQIRSSCRKELDVSIVANPIHAAGIGTARHSSRLIVAAGYGEVARV